MPRTHAEHAARIQGFGAYIRARRQVLGLTQRQLGRRLGYYQERISSIERGTYGWPALLAMAEIADGLEIDLVDLIEAAGFAPHRSSSAEPGDVAESA